MTHCAVLNGAALFHTAKCCTNTVRLALMPPFTPWGIERLTDEPTVGFVRHPLDRFVSCWANTVMVPEREHLATRHRMTGERIPGVVGGMSADAFSEVVAAHPLANRHWIPQSQWLRFRDCMPDHLVPYEDLYPEWEALRWRFDWPRFPKERLNRSDRVSWQETLSDASIDRLAGVYRDDFESFGYPVP